jgi:hypothetical protein
VGPDYNTLGIKGPERNKEELGSPRNYLDVLNERKILIHGILIM